ncbi:MAG: GDCCVxC domain-containing (seleno)protein [Candidatus Hodarchaeales archaeon]
MQGIKTESTLKCPHCGFAETLEMPTKSCLIRHECSNCQEMIIPKKGDCCVFCSYGDTRCPPEQ